MMIDGYVAEILNNQIMNDINAKKATDKEFADYIHVHSVPINLVANAVVKALEDVKAEINKEIEDKKEISHLTIATKTYMSALVTCRQMIDRKIAEVKGDKK